MMRCKGDGCVTQIAAERDTARPSSIRQGPLSYTGRSMAADAGSERHGVLLLGSSSAYSPVLLR